MTRFPPGIGVVICGAGSNAWRELRMYVVRRNGNFQGLFYGAVSHRPVPAILFGSRAPLKKPLSDGERWSYLLPPQFQPGPTPPPPF